MERTRRWFRWLASNSERLQLQTRFVPLPLLRLWPALRNHRSITGRVVGENYREKIRGGSEMDFFSGGGSHNPDVVNPFVRCVREFLASLGRPVTVVDLGCGDFNIGNRLTDLAATYIASMSSRR